MNELPQDIQKLMELVQKYKANQNHFVIDGVDHLVKASDAFFNAMTKKEIKKVA